MTISLFLFSYGPLSCDVSMLADQQEHTNNLENMPGGMDDRDG